MRFHFNRRPVDGPWGGGSKVLRAVVDEAQRRGHSVTFEGDDSGGKIDLMYIVDPRPKDGLAADYFIERARFDAARIVLRVGDVGSHGKPDLTWMVNDVIQRVDLVIYPSTWAKKYMSLAFHPISPGSLFESIHSVVIRNEADPRFLSACRRTRDFRNADELRVVTHHWSDNHRKGFRFYQMIDTISRSLGVEFTFIGRKPSECVLRNHVQPLDVEGLCRELPKHDVYLTASEAEAGANHVLEAMAIGLPVIHIANGGSIEEYCLGRGVMCDNEQDAHDILMHCRERLFQLASSMSPGEWNQVTRSTIDLARDYVDRFEWMVTA